MTGSPEVVRLGFVLFRRIRLVAYGASLESWLGASPHGFESHILRSEKAPDCSGAFVISLTFRGHLGECA
jgi:hypothetical protein